MKMSLLLISVLISLFFIFDASTSIKRIKHVGTVVNISVTSEALKSSMAVGSVSAFTDNPFIHLVVDVQYYDPKKARVLTGSFYLPNGINVSVGEEVVIASRVGAITGISYIDNIIVEKEVFLNE